MANSPSPKDTVRQPYWCFISYRHSDNKDPGRQWATWLHQQIETYEVPTDLVGTTNERGDTIPERIFPVFRDEEELPANADLGSPIYSALDRSLFLLVLCSPRAVQSTYVADEILYYKRFGNSNCVLAAMIDGEPNASLDAGKQKDGVDPERECFPEPLQFVMDESGSLDRNKRAEPIAADFRLPDGSQGWTSPEAFRQSLEGTGTRAEIAGKVAAYRKQCELARLKIIAGILGVPLGTLTKRDKAYQLEKEQRRARIFRRVAAALGVLSLAAIGAGVFAFKKRQEAVANRNLAEDARETAVKNQQRAESAEGEAKENLGRATGLLWEASSNAWNEAERSYKDDEPQSALAYLAAGIRNAPENTGLVTFASCILGGGNFPVRTLNFDLPVANVAFVRGKEQIIVAELLYTEATRYSLWDPMAIEKLDEAIVPTGAEISDKQKELHPWLESAPPTRTSNNAEGDELEPTYSSSGMRLLSADHDRVRISGLGISWTHPWFDYQSDQGGYVLPDSAWATGYAWNPDGSRIVTSHGYIDEVSEQNRGKVCLWDLRQSLGSSLLPKETVSFDEIDSGEGDHSSDGDFRLHNLEDRYEITREEADTVLWSFPYDSAKNHVRITTYSAHNEALLVTSPAAVYDDEGEVLQEIRLKLELRDLSTGDIVAESSLSLGKAESPADSPTIVVRHPTGQGFLILTGEHLISWSGRNELPILAPDLGPKDRIGWAGDAIFVPDGESILVGTHRKLLRLAWPELTLAAGPRYHDTIVSALATNDEGTQLISAAGFGDGAGSSGYAQLWSLPELEPIGPRLTHASQVSMVSFVGSGQAFISGSESPDGSDIRLWDSRTGLPLTPHLTAPPATGQAFINFSDFTPGTFSTIEAYGQVDAFGEGTFAASIATPGTASPPWFHEHFLPFAAGKELTAEGNLGVLSIPALRSHYNAIQDHLDGSGATASDVYSTLARWYLADPSSRTVAPFSEVTLDRYLEDRYFAAIRKGNGPFDVGALLAFDPRHPLVHLHMALKEKDLEKKRHFLRWGYALLARPLNAGIYGKERWHEQLLTGQKIFENLEEPAAAEGLRKILDSK